MHVMAFLFWLSAGVIIYVYIGYPLLIALLAWLRTKPVRRRQIQPSVTLLIAAYNEEDVIREKIENSLILDYPEDKLEIAIVADGSTDRTSAIVLEYSDQSVVLYYQPGREGKMAALNRAVPLTHGEIILFSDANNLYRRNVIQKVVRNFADPSVGAVSGQKILGGTKSAIGESENLYWRYESFIRTKESHFSSTTGVQGEILAIRRQLYVAPPKSVINDDFFLAMQIIKQGCRVIYEQEAISEEIPTTSMKGEVVRRSRISAGNIQALLMLPRLLQGAPVFAYFQAISHSLLRPLVPLFMVVALVTNLLLVMRQTHLMNLIIGVGIAQALFYVVAAGGAGFAKLGLKVKPFYLPYHFCATNFACVVGLCQFLLGKQTVLWTKARGESWRRSHEEN